MTDAKNNKITFAWWNTSLSPYSKADTSSQEHKDFVIYTLLRLFENKNVDVLCLCEVSDNDIKYINEKLKLTSVEFAIYNGALKTGGKKFDFCVIYKQKVLTLVDSEVVSKKQITKTIHAAQELSFIVTDTGEPINLYIVHWSSRLYDYEDSPNKIQLGSLLRAAIDDCRDTKNIKHVIVLGDFNDEPFNKSLTHSLFASRDVELVRKIPGLLYNPFWRHLVHSKLHPHNNFENEGCGTYFYRGDQANRWKTFDQMIFSSDFVRGDCWYLNESKTEIFSDKDFIGFIYSSKSRFDHLPIISVIERVQNG